mgnify:CR=1 FL=1
MLLGSRRALRPLPRALVLALAQGPEPRPVKLLWVTCLWKCLWETLSSRFKEATGLRRTHLLVSPFSPRRRLSRPMSRERRFRHGVPPGVVCWKPNTRVFKNFSC